MWQVGIALLNWHLDRRWSKNNSALVGVILHLILEWHFGHIGWLLVLFLTLRGFLIEVGVVCYIYFWRLLRCLIDFERYAWLLRLLVASRFGLSFLFLRLWLSSLLFWWWRFKIWRSTHFRYKVPRACLERASFFFLRVKLWIYELDLAGCLTLTADKFESCLSLSRDKAIIFFFHLVATVQVYNNLINLVARRWLCLITVKPESRHERMLKLL